MAACVALDGVGGFVSSSPGTVEGVVVHSVIGGIGSCGLRGRNFWRFGLILQAPV